MGDIRREPNASSFHNLHEHVCPNCHRNYSCNCYRHEPNGSLVCTDCEAGRYDPMIYGGTGEKSEA